MRPAVAADLLDRGSRKRIVDATMARFGRIDILINNAGIGLYAPAYEASLAVVGHMFELNFFAALEMAQLVSAPMRAALSGFIVNVSSIAGKLLCRGLLFTRLRSTRYAHSRTACA